MNNRYVNWDNYGRIKNYYGTPYLEIPYKYTIRDSKAIERATFDAYDVYNGIYILNGTTWKKYYDLPPYSYNTFTHKVVLIESESLVANSSISLTQFYVDSSFFKKKKEYI